MYNVYTFSEKSLHPQEELLDRCWINVVDPTHEEIRMLEAEYELPEEFVIASLDPDERGRYEAEEETHLIILRIPLINRDPYSDVPYTTLPLGIILKQSVIITICKQESELIADFLRGKVKKFDPERRLRFALQLFYRAALRYLSYLRDINGQTNELEQQLQESQRNKDLIQLLNYQKSLVFFTTSLRSNQLMMERFKKTAFFRQAIENERDLLEDVIIDTSQAIEMANIYTSILNGLMDTFASVISNNLSVVMKRLTKITLMVMLPTLVFSFYGMNVSLPFADAPNAYVYILLSSVITIVAGYLLLSQRRF